MSHETFRRMVDEYLAMRERQEQAEFKHVSPSQTRTEGDSDAIPQS